MSALVEHAEVLPPRERASLEEPFRLVFVCTANRARSPLAAALLRRRLSGFEGADVRSAGTLSLDGAPPLPSAVRAGRMLEIDLEGHRLRSLGTGSLSSADLVLGFEPFHLDAAVAAGARPERTFLLAELVALLPPDGDAGDPLGTAWAAIQGAHARRAGSGAHAAATIADPVGQPESAMRETAQEIDGLVAQLARALFGRAGAGADPASP
jgi:protein-tyrosine phosphatase